MLPRQSIEDARDWLRDCVWADMEDEDFDDLSDNQVRRGVENHWEGGWADFVLSAGTVR